MTIEEKRMFSIGYVPSEMKFEEVSDVLKKMILNLVVKEKGYLYNFLMELEKSITKEFKKDIIPQWK